MTLAHNSISQQDSDPKQISRIGEVLVAFLRLGLTSFGGPVAHLGYFRDEFVSRRKWLPESAYSDIVAMCQLLPGPASSQVGMALGILRAGLPGGLAAWLGFTLPSAAALIAFGYGVHTFGAFAESGVMHGLKIAAVAVVAQAVWSMGKSLCPDAKRMSIAVLASLVALTWTTGPGQIAAIALCGVIGRFWLSAAEAPALAAKFAISTATATLAWIAFVVLLLGLPVLASAYSQHWLALFDSFYRSGALVFGGGHVVLPLLRAEVVPPGWIDDGTFLAGYGAAQAVPGPLFTFSAYLGTVMRQAPNGWSGGLLCLVAIFLPSFLLVVGGLPLWQRLRGHKVMQRALMGINAGVVGLLLAALYDPVWTSAIHSRADFGLALVAFILLTFWRASPVLVVGLAAGGGWVLSLW